MVEKTYYVDSEKELHTLSREITDNIYQFSSTAPYTVHVQTANRNPVDMKDFVDVLQYLHQTYPINVTYQNPYWIVKADLHCNGTVKSNLSYLIYYYEVEEINIYNDTLEVWFYPHCHQPHSSKYLKSVLSVRDSKMINSSVSVTAERNQFNITTEKSDSPIFVDSHKTIDDLKQRLNQL